MATPSALNALRKLENAKLALLNAIMGAAHEYADGGNRGEALVRRHFTAGNQGRYRWPDLSPAYARAKAAGTVKTSGGVAFLNAKQAGDLAAFMGALSGVKGAARKAARAQKVAEMRGGRSASKADKSQAGGLPMLVLSGRLRDAVSGKGAAVSVVPVSPTQVRITWTGLPDYAVYHHKGMGVPKRSPIEPNESDRRAIIMAARRILSASLATGTTGPVSAMGGRARVVP